MAEGTFRLRVRYPKVGRLRFLSHLEVMRALERSVRRAGLPYAVTQGFNPKMKAGFGPALPVGTAGEREYYDVWLTAFVRRDEALERLRASTPEGMLPDEAAYVAERSPSLSAALTVARYVVGVRGAEGLGEALPAGLEVVLGLGELEVPHKGKVKRFDLATSLAERPEVRTAEGGTIVALAVRLGEAGSLRPEALVRAALDHAGVDAATEVTRTDLLEETEEGFRPPLG